MMQITPRIPVEFQVFRRTLFPIVSVLAGLAAEGLAGVYRIRAVSHLLTSAQHNQHNQPTYGRERGSGIVGRSILVSTDFSSRKLLTSLNSDSSLPCGSQSAK